VEAVEVSSTFSSRACDNWRSGGRASASGWHDAGIQVRESNVALPGATDIDTDAFVEGALVRHDRYGLGQVTEASGYGALRKVKVRFPAAGEHTFMAAKAKLAIVHGEDE
jgi:DNA helicase-2/ATP-dependent DNA helicase PcrA